jgi:DNA-binding NarL/FixJ family response regulator
MRVMVVDDHDLTREAVCETLDEENDIEVVACCREGQEAIETLDQAQPDVVITDLAMPRPDGVDTIAHVRHHHPDVPVLVLTAAPHGQHAAAALIAGADRILGKPLDLTDLAKAIRAAHTHAEN